jgi:tetratricopeptide (TPR) repeat protein
MERKPTENAEAYLAFVQAHDLQCAVEDFGKLKQSEQLYARAVELDPKFALALARYSQLESWIFHIYDPTRERRQKARVLAEQALQLQPDLPEAHLAMGFSYYYGDNNYDAAQKEFEIARRGLPNESEVYLALGAIQRRQGKWAESTANLEKAASLNPKDSWPLQNLAENYQVLRNFDAANKTIDRALLLDPRAFSALEIKAKLAMEETGDLSVAEKTLAALESLPQTPDFQIKLASARITMCLFLRRFDEVARQAEKVPDELVAAFPGALCSKYTAIGMAKKALRDDAGAQEVFLKAKKFAEDEIKQNPDDASAHSHLAEALAWLGEKNAALAASQRATELLPESKDAFGGPEISSSAAEVHAILGDTAGAVTILDGLLSRPSSITVPALQINPVWDSIRSDARFQALIKKYGAKV